ncbi:MAG: hypothetical protein L6R42_002537 [Xanthoria sp. 1 TBL-2021]|nr:MAG: hypothetical protein L6R42_002537 [Xanthoria sp. 1 TBL-2021]
MVDHQAPFTKPHRKGEKSHEEITVHLAVNGKRPRTAHECRTAVVVKAPWGNKSDRWNIVINGCRYFVIFEYGSWWSWNGDKEGLSHKAVAFPVENFRARRSSSPSSSSSSDSNSSASRGTGLNNKAITLPVEEIKAPRASSSRFPPLQGSHLQASPHQASSPPASRTRGATVELENTTSSALSL